MKQSIFAGLAGLVMLALASLAPLQAQDQGQPQATAETFIQTLGDQATKIASDKASAPARRDSRYRDLLQQAFDMPTIGRFVIGRNWAGMSPAQQQDYMQLFEDLILKTYGDKMNFYSGQDFKVVGARPENDRDQIISSQIIQPGGKSIRMDWRVRQRDSRFTVLDVMIEGVSQSVTLRQEYASLIQRSGIDGLLQTMRERAKGG
jgi:phospholipid transport system substrate-binding protein